MLPCAAHVTAGDAPGLASRLERDHVPAVALPDEERALVQAIRLKLLIGRGGEIHDEDAGVFHIWYGHRTEALDMVRQRTAYMQSEDGIHWQRMDDRAGIGRSDGERDSDAWDSEMVCYPNVFTHGGRKYLLYNGNGYGKSGIGLAVEAD